MPSVVGAFPLTFEPTVLAAQMSAVESAFMAAKLTAVAMPQPPAFAPAVTAAF